MPNTLAHLGIQTFATKSIARTADIKWIAVGCILPDLPWITQRLVAQIVPDIDLLDLRIYSMIQASFFFCLILGAAIASCTRTPQKVFLLISANALGHLLLDAMQTKWANGVHLLAPFNWKLSGFQLFWPEATITLLLTLAGLAAVVIYGWRDRNASLSLIINKKRLILSALFLSLYLLLPLSFFNGPLQADNHYVQTLKNRAHRTGKEIGFDRCTFDKKHSTITVFTKEQFKLTRQLPEQDGKVSLIGTFIDNETIAVTQLHEHFQPRDYYSYTGLMVVFILWAGALLRGKISINRNKELNNTFRA